MLVIKGLFPELSIFNEYVVPFLMTDTIQSVLDCCVVGVGPNFQRVGACGRGTNSNVSFYLYQLECSTLCF